MNTPLFKRNTILLAQQLLIITGILFSTNTSAASAPDIHQYVESSKSIQNPERGFINNRWVDLAHEPFNDDGLTLHKIRNELGQTLVRTYVNLRPFINGEDISSELLTKLQNYFDQLKKERLKTILIFSYSPHGDHHKDGKGSHGSKETIIKHINQISQIINTNKHVISLVQMGLVGRWGEWNDDEGVTEIITGKNKHASLSYDERLPHRTPQQKEVVEALLAKLPASMFTQMRSSGAKRKMFEGTLTPATAFKNNGLARVGYHNDCFVTDDHDYGTFDYHDPLEKQKERVSNDTKWLPMGGETCVIDKNFPERATCKVALKELEQFHYSFLRDVTNMFKQQGCFDIADKKMGYRFVLRSARFAKELMAKKSMSIELTIENVGWATPYNKRPVFIVARLGKQKPIIKELNQDVRHWLPGKQHIKATLELPDTAKPGEYTLSLWMPDASLKLRNIPEYAIQLANEDMWSKATGDNVLGKFNVK